MVWLVRLGRLRWTGWLMTRWATARKTCGGVGGLPVTLQGGRSAEKAQARPSLQLTTRDFVPAPPEPREVFGCVSEVPFFLFLGA